MATHRPTDFPWLEQLGFPFIDSDWLTHVRGADAPEPLERIGEYELLEEIGHGGQAVVYRARRGSEIVAIKRLRPATLSDVDARHRFEREIEAVLSLSHPRVVQVLDVLREERRASLVLRWVDGRPLTEWAADEARTPRDIARVVRGACEGLLHAHQRGVLHRDLKPSNVLVDRNDQAHILDFGIARLTDQDHSPTTLTSPGDFLGTLAYASPEQLLGDRSRVDARSDVYSLGVVLFHALTGRLPWTLGNSLASAVRALSDEDPPAPSSWNPAVHRDLDAIVLKALRKERAERYQSADALAEDLGRWLRGDPVEAQGRSMGYVLSRMLRRHRLATSIAAVSLAAGVGLVSWLGVMYQRAETAAARAERVQAFLEDTVADRGSPLSGPSDVAGLLDRTSQRATLELQSEPAVELRLRNQLAGRFAELGLWERAGEEATLAISLGPAAGGSPRDIAQSHYLRGLSLGDKQDPAGIPDLEEALALYRGLYPDGHPGVERVRTTLAAALITNEDARDLPRAEQALVHSLSFLEKDPGTESRPWAMAVFCLGLVRAGQGDHETAVAHFRECLGVIGDGDPRRDRSRSECYAAIGASLNKLDRFEEAEVAFREALALERVAAVTPIAWANLGTSYLSRNLFAPAIECYEQAVIARCRWLAVEDQDSRDELEAIATAVATDGFDGAAAERFHRLITGREPKLDDKFRYTVGRLSECWRQLGHMERAEGLRAALP